MRDIVYTSTLAPSYQRALEELLFFNPNQEQVSAGILAAVQRYGTPRVATADDRLWVTFSSGVETQSLFVLEHDGPGADLIGVVVYTRRSDTLVVVFLAVREDYSCRGPKADAMLPLGILDALRRIARRVKGITCLTLFLGGATAARFALTADKKPAP